MPQLGEMVGQSKTNALASAGDQKCSLHGKILDHTYQR